MFGFGFGFGFGLGLGFGFGIGLELGLGLAVEHSAKELAPESAIPGELPPRLGSERGLG